MAELGLVGVAGGYRGLYGSSVRRRVSNLLRYEIHLSNAWNIEICAQYTRNGLRLCSAICSSLVVYEGHGLLKYIFAMTCNMYVI